MNRRTVLFSITVLMALSAGIFHFNEAENRARIIRYSGDIFIERSGRMIIPVIGRILGSSDKITTGEGAFIEIAYDRGLNDVVRVGAGSHVVLESGKIEKETKLYMTEGDIILKLNKLKKGSSFKVRTPTAVCGVRGTSFGVRLKDGAAVITDYESKIFVKGLTPDFKEMDDELLLSGGWKVMLKQFEAPTRVAKVDDDDRSVWLSWLVEIDSMVSYSPLSGCRFSGFIYTAEAALVECSRSMGAAAGHITLSFLLIAFMAYIGVVINLRRAFVA